MAKQDPNYSKFNEKMVRLTNFLNKISKPTVL